MGDSFRKLLREGGAGKNKPSRKRLPPRFKNLLSLPSVNPFASKIPVSVNDAEAGREQTKVHVPNWLSSSRWTIEPMGSTFGASIRSSVCRRDTSELNGKEHRRGVSDFQRVVERGNGKMKKGSLPTVHLQEPENLQSCRAHQPSPASQEDVLPQPTATTVRAKNRRSQDKSHWQSPTRQSPTRQTQHKHNSRYRSATLLPSKQWEAADSSISSDSFSQPPPFPAVCASTPKIRLKSIDQTNGLPWLLAPVASSSTSALPNTHQNLPPSSATSTIGFPKIYQDVLDDARLGEMMQVMDNSLDGVQKRLYGQTSLKRKLTTYFRTVLEEQQQRNVKKGGEREKHVSAAPLVQTSTELVSQLRQGGINGSRTLSPGPARTTPGRNALRNEEEIETEELLRKEAVLSARSDKDWHSDALSLFQSHAQSLLRTVDHAQLSGKTSRRVAFEGSRSQRDTAVDEYLGITNPIDSLPHRRLSTKTPHVDSAKGNCSSNASRTSLLVNVSRNELGQPDQSQPMRESDRLFQYEPFLCTRERITAARRLPVDNRRLDRSVGAASSAYDIHSVDKTLFDGQGFPPSKTIVELLTISPPRTFSTTRLF